MHSYVSMLISFSVSSDFPHIVSLFTTLVSFSFTFYILKIFLILTPYKHVDFFRTVKIYNSVCFNIQNDDKIINNIIKKE